MPHRWRRLAIAIAVLGSLLPGLFGAPETHAAQRCFAETGYCIDGRMHEFWEQNGGLPVFGFPITPLQTEVVEGRSIRVQWFERNRLELHPENRRPYDVLLGRIGADRLAFRPAGGAPGADAGAECRLFAETGRRVCGDILAAWRTSGLELDGRRGKNEAESLALFGLPLTDLRAETLGDGYTYQVQWFERARFELHPENRPAGRVLLGLLGRESGPVAQQPAPVVAAAPARMVIEAIGLDQSVVGVGVDRQGSPIVPDHGIGWFNQSAMPGQGENVVFWGHVLRFRNAPKIPAPFARLKELQPGARVVIYDSAGAAHLYRVTEQTWVTPDQVRYILPQGRERLTLVSCIGSQVISGGEVIDMSHRLITIAEPE